MPLYEYRCPDGHTAEELRKYVDRDEPVTCGECGAPMVRILSAHHQQPDGLYSHCPNIGTPDNYERKHDLWKRQQMERAEKREHRADRACELRRMAG